MIPLKCDQKQPYQVSNIWVIHSYPGRCVATYRPGKHYNVFNLEAQLMDGILHHGVRRIVLLVWEWNTLKNIHTLI